MDLKRLQIRTCLFTLTLLASSVSFADVVVGTFSIAGTADVTATGITWICSGFEPACPPNSTLPADNSTGDFVVTNSGGGPFVPTALSAGLITELSTTETPVGPSGFTPVLNWLVDGDTSLTLTEVPAGTDPTSTCAGPATVGQTCTPIIGGSKSLYNFQNISNNGGASVTGFTASFTAVGDAIDTATGATHPFTATFTATINNESFEDALTSVLGGGSIPNLPYTANFTLTSVPEPGFLSLFGGASLLVAFAGLYRKVRHQQQ
jgi:hypothetical protein